MSRAAGKRVVIMKMTDLKSIEELAGNAARMPDEQVKAFMGYLEEQVAEILGKTH